MALGKRVYTSQVLGYKQTYSRKRNFLSNSIYSVMGETVLVLDGKAVVVRGSNSEFTVDLHQPLILDKDVDY